MIKKRVHFAVTVDIEDHGEFDQYALRDGIMSGIQVMQNEGNLTLLEDASTGILGFNVEYVPAEPEDSPAP